MMFSSAKIFTLNIGKKIILQYVIRCIELWNIVIIYSMEYYNKNNEYIFKKKEKKSMFL